MYAIFGSSGVNFLALPKSHNLRTFVSGLMRTLCGLMSRWQIPFVCTYAIALNN